MHEQPLSLTLDVAAVCKDRSKTQDKSQDTSSNTYKHIYMSMSEVNSYRKPILVKWVKDGGAIPSGLSDGRYSV